MATSNTKADEERRLNVLEFYSGIGGMVWCVCVCVACVCV